MVGLGGLEPPTSRLSGVRSNHLSYKPILSLAVTDYIILNKHYQVFLLKKYNKWWAVRDSNPRPTD